MMNRTNLEWAMIVAVTQKACDMVRIEKEINLSFLERKCLQGVSEANREKGVSLANEICKNYRREGRFMNSKVAAYLDSRYNRMQWAGEEYLLEELADEQKEKFEEGEQYSKEVLYWAGYLYRYWHYYTGETSKKIYQQANAKTMKRNYMMFHTMDTEIAVDDLKEIYRQRHKK